MIRKIISSGQTGVELAALDIAVKLGISHGGWITRGKRNEDGPLPDIYDLKATASLKWQDTLEKNVSDADGTLIISKGMKTDRTEAAVQAALRLQRQLLHLDLRNYPLFEAAALANSWLTQKHIQVVYITGPQASEDAQLYTQTAKILETVFYLGFVKSGLQPDQTALRVTDDVREGAHYPQSVADAVERLKNTLSLKDRSFLANLQPDELNHLHSGLSEYIKQNFGLYADNQPLLQSCAETGKLYQPLPDEACAVIIHELWKNLRGTHKLRVIK